MTILVTGAAGFIGAALSQFLLDRGDDVIGVDDLNHYYDVNVKKDRLEGLVTSSGFGFDQLDISDRSIVSELFSTREFSVVVHLAAQAGVRYSIENPSTYVDTNLVGFGNILEGCRHQEIDHLVYASSSSVYGANTKLPFSDLIMLIIRSHCTQPPRKPMSSWRMPTRIFTSYRQRVFDFLRSTALGVDLIWRFLSSRREFSTANRSQCTTGAR